MNKIKDILIELFWISWKGILQVSIILTVFAWLPNKSLTSIILTVLTTSYGFKLFTEKPTVKDWLLVTPLKTGLSLAVIYYSWIWFGGFGILGVILLMFLLAAWQIINNWKLYDSVTMWGALKVKGREQRDFFTYYKEETGGETIETRSDKGEDGSDSKRRGEEADTQGSFVVVEGGEVLQEQTVQEVPIASTEQRTSGIGDEPKASLRPVQKKIRKRIRKLKKVT